MPFSADCQNKGCHKRMEPYIDPKTNIVYCSLCENEMTNITSFTKTQMKSLKQFKPKVSGSFFVKCQKCNKEGRPKEIDKKIVCFSCLKEHEHLTEPFKIMLKEMLKSAGKDVA